MEHETPPDLIDTRAYVVDVTYLAKTVALAAAVLKTVHDREKFALVLGASIDRDASAFAALLDALSAVLDQVALVATAAQQLALTEPPTPIP